MDRPATKLLRHAERVKIKGTSGQQGYRYRQRVEPTTQKIQWSKKDGPKFVGA